MKTTNTIFQLTPEIDQNTINMKFLVALSCLLAVALAKPGLAPLGYSNVVAHQVAGPVAYSTVSVARNAIAAPIAQTYTVNGVAAPVAAVAQTYAAPVAQTYAAPVAAVAQTYAAPVATVAHTYAAPVVAPVAQAYAAPVAVAAPLVQKSQYHAQDELGQASYGHAEPLQVHNAVQDAAGNKVGSYSYVAPDGQVIAANYVADALGYRVASNALPAAPAIVPVAPADTPEVAAAKAAHLSAHALVKSRVRRGIVTAYHAAPVVHSAYAYHAAPVYRAATLSTVVNTPGHAVSYQVY